MHDTRRNSTPEPSCRIWSLALGGRRLARSRLPRRLAVDAWLSVRDRVAPVATRAGCRRTCRHEKAQSLKAQSLRASPRSVTGLLEAWDPVVSHWNIRRAIRRMR
jgi:hypothetical protein